MSLKVEPHLYADRAGAFVEALQEYTGKKLTIIFTGTVGGPDQKRLQIGDIVAPGPPAE